MILSKIGSSKEVMVLLKKQEKICREIGYKYGLILCLRNQAVSLTVDFKLPQKAVPIIEEAFKLVNDSDFDTLKNEVRQTLIEVRNQMARHR
jgi:virulence-associated protein VagC